MIGFTLTEEQEDLRRLAHRFAEEEIRPVAQLYDEKEEMAWDVLKKGHEIGLHSYHYPVEYGGGGIESLLTECLVSEELAWGCAGIATALGGTSLAMLPVMIAGNPEQKKRTISYICSPGLHLAAMCLTEPNAGSDVAAAQTTARRDGDYYVLNGVKCFITNGGVADIHIVYASTDRSLGGKGLTAFIVDKGTPGLTQGKKEKKMGIRSSHTAEVCLEDCRVPVTNRLGEEGQGFFIAMKMLENSRPSVGAQAVGVARAAYELALSYAKERVQFGRPIARQQAIGFMLADMAMAVEAARLLVWRAAAAADSGKGCNLEGSMAKCFAGDTAMKVTTDAVQILGGYGYMREYPAEKWMRDAKIMQIYEGTNQIQRVVISGMITA